MCAGGEHPVQIPGEHIDLDVELPPGGEAAERGLRGRVWDDVDREIRRSVVRVADVVHGERNSVERDGTLAGDHPGEAGGNAHADADRIAFRADSDHFADRIDVARDDMAAKLVADAQGSLQVEARALAPEVGCGARHRLAGNVDGKPVAALVDDGEADAGAGDGGPKI